MRATRRSSVPYLFLKYTPNDEETLASEEEDADDLGSLLEEVA